MSRDEQGFTLVELMTALSITVILTGAMLGLTQRAQSGSARVTRDVAAVSDWQATLDQLTTDLRQAATVTAGVARLETTGGPTGVVWTLHNGTLTRREGERITRSDDGVADLRVQRDGTLHRIELSVHRPGSNRLMLFTAAVAARTEGPR